MSGAHTGAIIYGRDACRFACDPVEIYSNHFAQRHVCVLHHYSHTGLNICDEFACTERTFGLFVLLWLLVVLCVYNYTRRNATVGVCASSAIISSPGAAPSLRRQLAHKGRTMVALYMAGLTCVVSSTRFRGHLARGALVPCVPDV